MSLAGELQRDWARLQTVPALVEIVLTDRLLKESADVRGPGMRVTFTVDLHHHVIPDFYSREASNEGGNAAGGITPPRWSLDAAIAYLDEAGIDVAVPSVQHARRAPW